MNSMVERWKESLNSFDQKLASPPLAQNTDLKKSMDRSKRSLHNSHDGKTPTSKRNFSASKQKNKKKITNKSIEHAKQQILSLFKKSQTSADRQVLLTHILEQLYQKAISQSQTNNNLNNLPTQIMQISMQQSGMSGKKQEKLYHDLEKKYFQCEKQRQYLKNKVEGIKKQYEQVDRQLQRYAKMERLIDSCLERQDQLKKQNKKIRQDLQIAELRQIEQQKIFQKQIAGVHLLVDQIRKNLPSQ